VGIKIKNLLRMKNIFGLFLFAFAFFSCGTDESFNNPSVQGVLNDEVWRADSKEVVVNNAGELTLTAMRGYETLEINLPDYDQNDTIFFNTPGTSAKFIVDAPDSYTLYDSTEEADIDLRGRSYFYITEYNSARGYISGVFGITAPIVTGFPINGEAVNIRKGNFYRIPLRD
jgi:hypothetical protein